jgi:cyclophilin family peptidyl-prolyl cis-trans isomerase/protein-disulfide isomerase
VGLVLRRCAFATIWLVLSGCTDANRLAGTPTADAVPGTTSTPVQSAGCTVVEAAPTPAAPAFLDNTPTDPTLGRADAPVTMLFYCDLQSAECEIFHRVLDELLASRGDDLRVIHRLYPVPGSAVPSLDKSVLSAKAIMAARRQDRFWEMRDLLHSRYEEWAGLSRADFRAWVLAEADSLDLDPARLASDLDSSETAAEAEQAFQSAVALGISSIPTVFINGRLQERAALSYDGLDATIGLIALGTRQYRSCPLIEIDPTRQYTATLHTEKGDIVIALDAANAPLAVNSFVFLARRGWYDGNRFFSVIPGFVAQAGDPSGTGQGGPGYYFLNEVTENARFDRPGVVGMTNVGPDTNGSQFFITFAPQTQFDGSYTVLGRVIKGMETVKGLTPRDPHTDANAPPGDRILSVTVEER